VVSKHKLKERASMGEVTIIGENGGEKVGHCSGGVGLLRAAQ
jgi:hypothetical protein